VGRACGTHGRREKILQSFGGKPPKERDHLEDQGIDERMGLEWTSGRLVGGLWSGFSWLSIGTVGGLL
jgi:hypothetical protein